MRTPFLLCALLWAATAAATPPYALPPDRSDEVEEDPFRWEARPLVLFPGADGQLEVVLRIPEGHRVYRDQVVVEVVEAGPLTAGDAVLPPGELDEDPAGGGPRALYREDVVVQVPLSAPAEAEGGVPVTLSLRHQGCRGGLCWSPVTVQQVVLVVVRPEDPR